MADLSGKCSELVFHSLLLRNQVGPGRTLVFHDNIETCKAIWIILNIETGCMHVLVSVCDKSLVM